VPLLKMAALVGSSAVAGAAIGWLFSSDNAFVFVTIAISAVVFMGLLGLFWFGAGFMPVEVVVRGGVVNWDGERYAMSVVRDCVYTPPRLELRTEGGRMLAAIDHVPADVGRWVSLAIRASLP
jgi:hypothetical protein